MKNWRMLLPIILPPLIIGGLALLVLVIGYFLL